MATVLQQQAKAAGVTINLKQVDPATFFGPNYLHWTFSQDFYNYSPYLAQVAQSLLPTSPFNETHWNQPHYVSLYKQANATVDPSVRRDIVHEMQMIDFTEGGYIIPAFIDALDAYSTKITGYSAAQRGPAAVRLRLRALLVRLTRKDLIFSAIPPLFVSAPGFPEGPTILDDGRIVLWDGDTGELLAYQDGRCLGLRAHRGRRPGARCWARMGPSTSPRAATSRAAATPALSPEYSGSARTGRWNCCSRRWRGTSSTGPTISPSAPTFAYFVFHRVGVGAGFPVRRPLARQAVRRQPGRRRRAAVRTAERLPQRDRLRCAAAALLDRVDGAPRSPDGERGTGDVLPALR